MLVFKFYRVNPVEYFCRILSSRFLLKIEQNSNARKRRVFVLRVTPEGQLKLRTIEKKEIGIVHRRIFAVKAKKSALLFSPFTSTNTFFTPLESPIIYAGDGGDRKHQLLIEGWVKALPFLTGFIRSWQWLPLPPPPGLQRHIPL